MPRPTRSALVAALLAAGGLALLGRPPRAAADGDAQPPVTKDRDKEREKDFDALQAALDKVRAISRDHEGKPLVVRPTDPKLVAVSSATTALAKDGDAKAVNKLIDKLDEKFDNLFADHAVHM